MSADPTVEDRRFTIVDNRTNRVVSLAKLPSLGDLIAERIRQVDGEGYTPQHDAGHPWEMVAAGICYAVAAQLTEASYLPADSHWPWEREAWKPSDDPIRNLVKAGALIAAEIDRLKRADA